MPVVQPATLSIGSAPQQVTPGVQESAPIPIQPGGLATLTTTLASIDALNTGNSCQVYIKLSNDGLNHTFAAGYTWQGGVDQKNGGIPLVPSMDVTIDKAVSMIIGINPAQPISMTVNASATQSVA